MSSSFDGLLMESERRGDLALMEDVVFDSSLVEHIVGGKRWMGLESSINASLNTLIINCYLISKVISVGAGGDDVESLKGLFLDYIFAISKRGKRLPVSIVTKNISIESCQNDSSNGHRLIASLLISPTSELYQKSFTFLVTQKTLPDYIEAIAKLVGEHLREENVEFTLLSFSKLHSRNSLLCLRMIGHFIKGFLKAPQMDSFFEKIFDLYYFPIITGAQTSQWTTIRSIAHPGLPQPDPIEKIIISLKDCKFIFRHSTPSFRKYLLTQFALYIATPLKAEQSAISGKRAISSFFEGESMRLENYSFQGGEEISFLLTRMIGKQDDLESLVVKLALLVRGDVCCNGDFLFLEQGNIKELKEISKKLPSLPLAQLLLGFIKQYSTECVKSFLPSLICALSFEEKERIVAFLKNSVLDVSLLSLLVNDPLLAKAIINQAMRHPSITLPSLLPLIYEKKSIFSRLSLRRVPSDDEWVGLSSLVEECSSLKNSSPLIDAILSHIPLSALFPHLKGKTLLSFLESPLAKNGDESPFLLEMINETWKKGDNKELLLKELEVYFGCSGSHTSSTSKMALFRNLILQENNPFTYKFNEAIFCALEHSTELLFSLLSLEEIKECLLKSTMTPDLWEKIEEVIINSDLPLLEVLASLTSNIDHSLNLPTPFEETVMNDNPLNDSNISKKVRITNLLELIKSSSTTITLNFSNSFKLSILFSKQEESSLFTDFSGLFELSIDILKKKNDIIHPTLALKVLLLTFSSYEFKNAFIVEILPSLWSSLWNERKPKIISVRNPDLDLTKDKRLLLLHFLNSLDLPSLIEDKDSLFLWILNNPLKDLPLLKDPSLEIVLTLLPLVSFSFHQTSSFVENILMAESPLQGIIILASLLSLLGDTVSPSQINDLIGKVIDSLHNDESVHISACKALGVLVRLLPDNDPSLFGWVSLLFERISSSKTSISKGESRALATIISCKRLWLVGVDCFEVGFNDKTSKTTATSTTKITTVGQKITGAIASKKENNIQRSSYLLVLGHLASDGGRCWEPVLVDEIIPLLLDCIGESGGGSGREEFKALARTVMINSLRSSSTPLGSRILIRSLLGLLSISLDIGSGYDTSISSPTLSSTETNRKSWRWQVGCLDCLTVIPRIPGNAEHVASDLSSILPILLQLLSRSGHFELQRAARECLSSWFSLVRSPEIRALGPLLVDSFIDPPQSSQRCIDSLLETAFAHTIDGPSLALLRPFLGRALGLPGGQIKKGVSNVLANLATCLVDPADIEPYLLEGDLILSSLIQGLGDPNPSVRGHFGKVLGLLVMVVGEESSLKNLSNTLFSICNSLNSSITAVDRFGAAKALSEIMAARGPLSLEEYLGKGLLITEGIHSPIPRVREAFACLIGFLPDSFAEFYSTKEEAIEALALLYHRSGLKEAMPDCLSLLSDNNEGVRDSSKIACQSFVKRFTTIDPLAIFDLLLQNLTSPSWRCRQGCLALLQEFLNEFTATNTSNTTTSTSEEPSDILMIPSFKELSAHFDTQRIHALMAKAYLLRFDPSTPTIRHLSLAIWKGLSTHPLRSLIDIHKNLIDEAINLLSNIYVGSDSNNEGLTMVKGAFEDLLGKIGDRILLPILEEISVRLGISDCVENDSNIEISQKDQQSLLYLASIASTALGQPDRFPALTNSLVSLSCRRSPSVGLATIGSGSGFASSPKSPGTTTTTANYIELSINALIALLKHSLLLPFAIQEGKEIFRGLKGIIGCSAITAITSTSKILPSILDPYLEEIYESMDPLSIEAILSLLLCDDCSSCSFSGGSEDAISITTNTNDLDWVIQTSIPKNATEFLEIILQRGMARVAKWVVPILEGTTPPTPTLVDAAILALEDDYDSVYQVSLSQFMESEWCGSGSGGSHSNINNNSQTNQANQNGRITCLRIIEAYASRVEDPSSLERFMDAWPQRIVSSLFDESTAVAASSCFCSVVERNYLLENFLSFTTTETFKGLYAGQALDSLVKGALIPFFLSGISKKEELASLILVSSALPLSSQNLISLTGSLIRVSKNSALLFGTLSSLTCLHPKMIKPFYPQLQRLFSSSLRDEALRDFSYEALSSLLPFLTRYEHLLTEWFNILSDLDVLGLDSVLSGDGGVFVSSATNNTNNSNNTNTQITLLKLLQKSKIPSQMIERIPEVSQLLLSSPSPAVRKEVVAFLKDSLEKYAFEDPSFVSSLCLL